MSVDSLVPLLKDAILARRDLLDAEHLAAVRLFNGFTEGCPDLVIDLYADTAVLHNYASPPDRGTELVRMAHEVLTQTFSWIRSALVKTRSATSDRDRRGVPLSDQSLARRVREHGLWYALDLTLHQDCSLYLDTRNLRGWAREQLRGMSVLNAFAYTGSLGVAALGGGAKRVVQLDRTQRFLDLARNSYALNGLPVHARDFVCADFFREAGHMRRRREMFDCVFLDPPFFASTSAGRVDQENESARLINKVRPLVRPGGTLVAVNNAVFVSGGSYMRALESLCGDGHLEILDSIPVPDDFVGFITTHASSPIMDPSPFNHSTKIAVLKVL